MKVATIVYEVSVKVEVTNEEFDLLKSSLNSSRPHTREELQLTDELIGRGEAVLLAHRIDDHYYYDPERPIQVVDPVFVSIRGDSGERIRVREF